MSGLFYRNFLKNERIRKAVPWLLILSGYLFDLIYVWKKGLYLLNSDVSSEMVLAQLLNRTNEIVSAKWYYSSELRVLNTQLIFRIGLLLFPSDWHFARVFSVAVLLLVLIVSGLYFVKQAHLGNVGIAAIGLLLWPVGRWYGWNVIANTYYVPHIAITFFSVGILLHILHLQRKSGSYILQIIILLLLSFTAGLGGVRQLMVCYCPLLVCSLLLFYTEVRKFPRGTAVRTLLESNRTSINGIFLAAMTCLSSGAGFLVNNHVFSNLYHFAHYDENLWGNFSLTTYINTCCSDFALLFGWQDNTQIISIPGLINIVAILLGFLTLESMIVLLFRLDLIPYEGRLCVLFFLSCLLLNGLVFSCSSNYNSSYWIPLLPFSFILLSVRYCYERTNKTELLSNTFLAFVISATVICGIYTTKSPVPLLAGSPISTDAEILAPAKWLVQNGYTQGYGTFWNSNIITELSNGKIEMWSVQASADDQMDTLTTDKWLQSTEHDSSSPAAGFFIIAAKYEENEHTAPRLLQMKDHIVYDQGNYRIYSFSSMAEYHKLLSHQKE